VEVLPQPPVQPTSVSSGPNLENPLVLTDGSVCDLATLDQAELLELHWQEEQILARRIAEAPKGSRERAVAIRLAYDTIARIHTVRCRGSEKPLVMGLDRRYVRLVLSLLRQQQALSITPSFFEVGFGSGALLKAVADREYDVAGVEVSAALHRQACELLGAAYREWLLVGDVRTIAAGQRGRHSLIFWNDVFEHIPTDEILEYLEAIRSMLIPGGMLVTITPNWHFRPSDITRDFRPRRTEAVGLHLKEYTLREVTDLLTRAGFQTVHTPLFQTKKQMFVFGSGLNTAKQLCEPLLEWLPFRLAEILCRGFCLNCTLAENPR
jgi:2-polyprenyl-3-methyl-5-hydroxy-6-metoxy-1,4-benzoquinol methylase